MNENEGIIRRKRKKPIERAGGKEAGGWREEAGRRRKEVETEKGRIRDTELREGRRKLEGRE